MISIIRNTYLCVFMVILFKYMLESFIKYRWSYCLQLISINVYGCFFSNVVGFFCLFWPVLSLRFFMGFLQLPQEGNTLVAARRLLTEAVSLVAERGLQTCELQQLRYTGLVVLQHVGSSQNRDQTHDPCIGRWIQLKEFTFVRIYTLDLTVKIFRKTIFLTGPQSHIIH